MSNQQISIDSLVKQIVNILDCQDNKKKISDGAIKVDIWKKFMNIDDVFKGKGTKVKVAIPNKRAEVSIMQYLKETSKTEDEKKDLAQKWLDKLMNESDSEGIEAESKNKEQKQLVTPLKPSEPLKAAPPLINYNIIQCLINQESDFNQQFNYLNTNSKVSTEDVFNLMKNELARRKTSEKDTNIFDLEYWAERVCEVANQYNIQPALLIAIMAQETNGNFTTKKINVGAGRGIMGITTIAAKDILTSRTDAYLQLDKDLAEDILYKKDENGEIIKDKSGNPIKRFQTNNELLSACVNDSELCLKVGLLTFEMKYMQQVVKNKLKLPTKQDWTKISFEDKIKMVQEQIVSGQMEISEEENIQFMDNAALKYNNSTYVYRNGPHKGRQVMDVYHEQVTDSLSTNGYNYNGDYLVIKKS